MIKKVIIGLILLVCICSSAFSVMTYYNPINNSNIDNTDSSSIIGNTNEDIKSIEDNPLINYIDNIDIEHVSEYFIFDNDFGMIEHFVYGEDNSPYLDYILWIKPLDYNTHDSDGSIHSVITYLITTETENGTINNWVDEILPDKYFSCAVCGKLIPANEITHPLTETALCHCEETGLRDSSLSIDTVVPIENNDFTPVTDIETVNPANKNVIDDAVYHEDNETYIDDFNQDFDNKETPDNYVDDYTPDNSEKLFKFMKFDWFNGKR